MDLPFWTAAPFAALLLAVAALPLAAGRWWHSDWNKAFVCAVCAAPVVGYLLAHGPEAREALGHELADYASFVALLGSLYAVAGGIAVTGHLRARPATNTAVLAAGAVLANLIGTTGASMVLVRPLLAANGDRRHTRHLPVFLIFVVGNTGGLLTPLGDPPLFLGFLRGVPFDWTLGLWPQWLAVNGAVLAVFFGWDTAAYRREAVGDLVRDALHFEPVRVAGWKLNVPLLAVVVLAVIGQKYLPRPAGEGVMVLAAGLSLWATPRGVRAANRFTWGPLTEVAVVFAGLFVTMVPALALLSQHGAAVPVSEPWQFFWLTGGLSAVLDNAPTYLAVGTLAAGGHDLEWLPAHRPGVLAAISCGAVFFGAMTYLGNGPNLLVRAIAAESGYPVPSFFGYMGYAAVVLLPVLAGVTVAFFL